ncbi:hypothetical protein [Rhizorhabdus dicambivorans]|uniref:hypothetical protein n=1 Tax=Rhizorhabdus dicambivorans TaxID=1850238 RepID=UPI000ABC1D25|nr:hypothetical protein [Rhizorhabdus dicambivorans]
MVYDRFAGIKSLPGPDGKMPRPFRVDEDGNVIYLDEEQNTARPEGERKAGDQRRAGIMSWDELDRRYEEELAAIRRLDGDKPIQLAEAGNWDWNGYEAMRAQGQRDGQRLKSASTPNTAHGVEDGQAVGVASRASRVGIEAAKVRARYNPQVRSLGPNDNAQREALKGRLRTESPPEVRGPLDALFPYKGPKPGSFGRANVPNEAVNQQARMFGKVGKGMGVLGVGLAGLDVLRADNKKRAIAANIGAGLGGVAGGAGGGAIGAATGPFAVVAAPAGGVAGAMTGGQLGYEAGEGVYDYIGNLLRRGGRLPQSGGGW